MKLLYKIHSEKPPFYPKCWYQNKRHSSFYQIPFRYQNTFDSSMERLSLNDSLMRAPVLHTRPNLSPTQDFVSTHMSNFWRTERTCSVFKGLLRTNQIPALSCQREKNIDEIICSYCLFSST